MPANTWVAHAFAAVLLLLGMSGCGSSDVECDADTPCGFGEDCVDGACVSGACATSVQCPMEQHCEGRECVDGCTEDGDCYPGDACDTLDGTCVAAACEETAVDCGFREFCNTATGDCYDAGGDYCRPCSYDTDCDEGNICFLDHCLVDCSGGRECPSSFECYGFEDDGGNVVFYGCFTYCWLYEGYEPGSFATAHSRPQLPPADPGPVCLDEPGEPLVSPEASP